MRGVDLGRKRNPAARSGDEQALVGELHHGGPSDRAERQRIDDLHRAFPLAQRHAGLRPPPQPERAEGEPRHQRQHDQELQYVSGHLRRSSPASLASAETTSTTRTPKRPLTVTISPLAIKVPLAMMSSSSCAFRSSSTTPPAARFTSQERFPALLPPT